MGDCFFFDETAVLMQKRANKQFERQSPQYRFVLAIRITSKKNQKRPSSSNPFHHKPQGLRSTSSENVPFGAGSTAKSKVGRSIDIGGLVVVLQSGLERRSSAASGRGSAAAGLGRLGSRSGRVCFVESHETIALLGVLLAAPDPPADNAKGT